MPERWTIRADAGPAAAMFDRAWPEPAEPSVWVIESSGPALVLGSTQPRSTVDAGRAAAARVDIVRRRSGGGAVLVEPGALVWVDVLVPAGDRLWEADVGRAFAWLGEAWAGAVADAGVPGAVPYDGALRQNAWSGRMCFAGLGPGEVTVGGAKVVGMCQRRTRAGALFQCAALLTWEPDRLLDLLDLGPDERRRAADDLSGAARGLDVDPAVLTRALLARLP